MHILVVEDEVRLAETLKEILKTQKYTCDLVYDGEDGLAYAESGIYDVILLDIMLPKMNGFDVVRTLRSKKVSTPVILLTARDEVTDKVKGLDCGADYYLTKPFDNRELLACINALLRRQGTQFDVLAYGNTSLDLTGCTLSTAGGSVRLSSKEFDVMRLLMQAEGRSVRKETILTRVWGFDSNAGDNNVEVYIGFLRKKLRAIGSNLTIEVIRLLGYHLEVHGA
mgnify:CR=1 FL=1